MTKFILSVLCILYFAHFGHAQTKYWTQIDSRDLKANKENIINYGTNVKSAAYFQLDKGGLFSQLDLAPNRQDHKESEIELEIPMPNGEFEVYKIFKTETLAPQLAQNYSEIKSYVGTRVDANDASVLRITVTPHGFYAMIKKPKAGQVFINKFDRNGDYYMSFFKNNARQNHNFRCEVSSFDGVSEDFLERNLKDFDVETFNVDDSTLRVYDLALACTGEYSQFHINQAGLEEASSAEQVEAVLAAMTVTIDRVNAVFEIDLGISLQIIANNDRIIFLNPESDPFSNSNIFSIVNENQDVIDSEIESAEYNIGHVFSTGGGGFAPGNVCVEGDKARAVTGLSNPVGDPFDIDYVSHEIGHQFSAGHTQNNDCNRFGLTAVEPGSASTIMGYAGICAPNVQGNSDANFHQISIAQIYNYVSIGAGVSCGSFISQPNTPPSIISIPESYTIPNATAFYLDVEAEDDEDDQLTYSWEQIDNEVSIQPPLKESTSGPNFRVFAPTLNSRRYFPKLEDVLLNNLNPTWEVVPSVARSMDFVVTVRDNNINVGQSDRAFVEVNFASVGPFQVTSQNTTGINWLAGETVNITWDVAGTTENGINTDNVNILLSKDGGTTFDTILISNTPNDGSEDIIVPDIQSSACRIMVKPVDNIYYALNAEDFGISNSNITCNQYQNNNIIEIPDGVGTTENPEQGPIVSSVISIPDSITNISDINITLDVSHNSISDLAFTLQAPNGETIDLWSRNCNDENSFNITFNDNGTFLPESNVECSDPLNGIYAPVDSSIDLTALFADGIVGDWTLLFSDFFPDNSGSLNTWNIEICSTNFSVIDNQFNDFSIIPNPNNGIFEINFSQPMGNDTDISIYDLRGRLIERIRPGLNSVPLRVQLQNQYQSGVYLLEITNENGKFIDKLIIR